MFRKLAFTAAGAAAVVLSITVANAQDEPAVISLWENGAPGYEDRRNEPEEAQDWWVKNIHNPSITAFLPDPEKATGTAVLVIPGGGHSVVVFPPEGIEPAQYFQEMGVAAFALKYRLANEEGSPYSVNDAAEDTRRAMRLIRHHAEEWNIDPDRIGVMGWSAGGVLASLLTYNETAGDENASDPIDREDAKPDFQIVIYPGGYGAPEKFKTAPPPAFFLAAIDDDTPAKTIIHLTELYRKAGVPAETHIYAKGGHGFNMGNRSELKSIHDWPQRMVDWMADSGLLYDEEQ